MRRAAVAVRAVLAVGALLAATGVTAVTAPTAEARGGVLWYRKGANNLSGSLTLSNSSRPLIYWRAGSGTASGWSNECLRNRGALPNGNYKTGVWHNNYNGSLIHGRAIRLDNKKCRDGTWRTELFIHSEQTVNNTQGGTEGSRWDGASDYASAGCIKMAPADLAALYWHSYNLTGGHPVLVVAGP